MAVPAEGEESMSYLGSKAASGVYQKIIAEMPRMIPTLKRIWAAVRLMFSSRLRSGISVRILMKQHVGKQYVLGG